MMVSGRDRHGRLGYVGIDLADWLRLNHRPGRGWFVDGCKGNADLVLQMIEEAEQRALDRAQLLREAREYFEEHGVQWMKYSS